MQILKSENSLMKQKINAVEFESQKKDNDADEVR
jgi:hypothetical protein